MAQLARQVVDDSLHLILEGRAKDEYQPVFDIEVQVNRLNHAISRYLSQLGRGTLSDEQRKQLRELHNVIADIERVGDHGENIAELGLFSLENELTYSDQAIRELREMADQALKSFDLAIKAWIENDASLAKEVFEVERTVDRLEKEVRTSHIDRLNRGECQPAAGIVFLDLASNLERVADHAANIAALVPEAPPQS